MSEIDDESRASHRLKALLAEYAYGGAQLREEESRLFQTYVALAVLISATGVFFNSDRIPQDARLIVPFGLLLWAILIVSTFTSIAGRGLFMGYLERKIGDELGDPDLLQWEKQISNFFNPVGVADLGYMDWKARLTHPWIVNYTIIGLAVLSIAGVFSAVAWIDVSHHWLRVPFLAGLIIAVLALVYAVWSNFQHLRRFERHLATLELDRRKAGSVSLPEV